MSSSINMFASRFFVAAALMSSFMLGAFITPRPANATLPQSGATPAPQNSQNQPAPSTDESNKAEPIYVRMKTSMGESVIELNPAEAPRSVENFLHYVDGEFYDGLIFHRVIPHFMIQGGGFTPDMKQKRPTRPPVVNEWRNALKNERGTIAMARTASRDSATSQFFINVTDNPDLDRPISDGAGYAVFGKVIHGMETVDKIRRVPTQTVGPHRNVPSEPVFIEEIRRLSDDEAKPYLEETKSSGPSDSSSESSEETPSER